MDWSYFLKACSFNLYVIQVLYHFFNFAFFFSSFQVLPTLVLLEALTFIHFL